MLPTRIEFDGSVAVLWMMAGAALGSPEIHWLWALPVAMIAALRWD